MRQVKAGTCLDEDVEWLKEQLREINAAAGDTFCCPCDITIRRPQSGGKTSSRRGWEKTVPSSSADEDESSSSSWSPFAPIFVHPTFSSLLDSTATTTTTTTATTEATHLPSYFTAFAEPDYFKFTANRKLWLMPPLSSASSCVCETEPEDSEAEGEEDDTTDLNTITPYLLEDPFIFSG